MGHPIVRVRDNDRLKSWQISKINLMSADGEGSKYSLRRRAAERNVPAWC